MKLVFLGTRGYIEARNPRHRLHTSLLVGFRRRRVMVDAGEDWRGRLAGVRPHAIVLTHAHPDHAAGLDRGADCPVYATQDTWNYIERYLVRKRRRLTALKTTVICGIRFTPFAVEHSTRCPAVGYRIEAGVACIFYAPDVAYIPGRAQALRGVDLYVGDGATMQGQMIRRSGRHLIGHAPVRTQLTWCSKVGVPEAIITHCGSEIVTGDERRLGTRLRHWAEERHVAACIAHDGMERILR